MVKKDYYYLSSLFDWSMCRRRISENINVLKSFDKKTLSDYDLLYEFIGMHFTRESKYIIKHGKNMATKKALFKSIYYGNIKLTNYLLKKGQNPSKLCIDSLIRKFRNDCLRDDSIGRVKQLIYMGFSMNIVKKLIVCFNNYVLYQDCIDYCKKYEKVCGWRRSPAHSSISSSSILFKKFLYF